MRIIVVTVFSLIAVFVLITMARIWGLSQPHSLYQHDFFKVPRQEHILVVNTLDEARDAVTKEADIILWLNVRFSQERVPFVLPPSKDVEFLAEKAKEQNLHPETPILIGSHLSDYKWEQINEYFKSTPSLREFYAQFSDTRFVLNLVDNVDQAHLQLIDSIQEFKPQKRTLIQSEATSLILAVRDLKPEWVYGTSVPDLMRLLTLDSMSVLPATLFKGDVFIAPFKLKNRPAFNDDIIAEMKRREKRIFLGPIESEQDLKRAQELNVQGFIFPDLEKMRTLLNLGPAQ